MTYMKTILRELIDDYRYISLGYRLLILGIMICFGSACFISGFVTAKL